MANLYLRVPHYVASYLRNKNRYDELQVGSPIPINKSERIWVEYCEGLCPNLHNQVNRAYCFTQRQWNTMMDGYRLTDDGHVRKTEKLEREDQLTLNDSEVFRLSGLPVPRGDDSGEYICIAVPREAMRYGRLVPTNASWFLRDVCANAVRTMLVCEFWRTLYSYVDKAIDKSHASNRKFVLIHVLNSFMERYNIRCSSDMRELEALKRNYNRKRKSYRFTEEDYVEFG